MQKKSFGLIFASAVSQILVASNALATAAPSPATNAVHCTGINSCKGTTDCKTAENACKGKNVCKGHGFILTTKTECAKKGGKISESPQAEKPKS